MPTGEEILRASVRGSPSPRLGSSHHRRSRRVTRTSTATIVDSGAPGNRRTGTDATAPKPTLSQGLRASPCASMEPPAFRTCAAASSSSPQPLRPTSRTRSASPARAFVNAGSALTPSETPPETVAPCPSTRRANRALDMPAPDLAPKAWTATRGRRRTSTALMPSSLRSRRLGAVSRTPSPSTHPFAGRTVPVRTMPPPRGTASKTSMLLPVRSTRSVGRMQSNPAGNRVPETTLTA